MNENGGTVVQCPGTVGSHSRVGLTDLCEHSWSTKGLRVATLCLICGESSTSMSLTASLTMSKVCGLHGVGRGGGVR